ncbi:hypothetical protein [Mesobacillus harenae]|uniref:hypothetical protein n=1 Tax=Mesobacillus harenae TaxID=2213203 RepID=UPI00158047B5|nr:hypothetical protein [Mesobacillus harenae]
MNKQDKNTVEANNKINATLEDSNIHERQDSHDNSEKANKKIQQEFYADENANENAPTYMYNNTPAIKIIKNQD